MYSEEIANTVVYVTNLCYVSPVIRYTNPQSASLHLLAFWRGWSGGAMVLGKLPVPGRPTIWITVGQGPTALAVGADGGCLEFLLSSILSPLSPCLWETARYRLKYCLKGPLNPKQPTNQPCILETFKIVIYLPLGTSTLCLKALLKSVE